jgi:hypothetical protein
VLGRGDARYGMLSCFGIKLNRVVEKLTDCLAFICNWLSDVMKRNEV